MDKYFVQICPYTAPGQASGGAECSLLDGEVSSLREAIEAALGHFNGEDHGSIAYVYHRRYWSSEVVASINSGIKNHVVCLP